MCVYVASAYLSIIKIHRTWITVRYARNIKNYKDWIVVFELLKCFKKVAREVNIYKNKNERVDTAERQRPAIYRRYEKKGCKQLRFSSTHTQPTEIESLALPEMINNQKDA